MSKIEEKDGKKFLKISVSKAKTFHQCKKLFKLSYIDKMPRISRDYHVLGTFCHLVLETFHKSYLEGSLKPFNEELTSSWKAAVKETKSGLTPEIKAEARNMMEGYLKLISKNKENGKLDNIIDVERNFKVNLDDKVLLNGMIDRIQIDEDNVVHVADYKSTKNKKYLKDDFFQLLTYAYVIMSDDPSLEKIRASYILLRHDFEYITKEFSREEVEKIHDEFIQIYNEMQSETEYAPSPAFLCGFCDALAQGLCEEGAEFVAKTRPPKKDFTAFGEVKW